jgi:hypothetical protein
MSARSFRSVGWVAGIAATALGCYMVNLKVASERSALEDVETRIVLAERDIRLLQTEIGTRGRLAQLEKWNVKVLALSAPEANQFMDGSFQLATLVAPKQVLDPAAPVVLASAAVPERQPVLDSDGPAVAPQPTASAASLLHTASLRRETVPATVVTAPQPAAKQADKPRPSAQVKKAVASPAKPVKMAAKAVIKPVTKPASDLLDKTASKVVKAAAKSKAPIPKPVITAATPAKPDAKAKAKTQEAQAKQ